MPLVALDSWGFRQAALLVLGATTAALQVLVVREGLAVASGNEAVIALLFGVWMLETAAGAAMASKRAASLNQVAFAFGSYGFCKSPPS